MKEKVRQLLALVPAETEAKTEAETEAEAQMRANSEEKVEVEVQSSVGKTCAGKIDWNRIENSGLRRFIEKMRQTQQNPFWHGEGDVWTHTKMVCEELIKMLSFQAQEERVRQELFLAALLHDIGKIPCTQLEDDVWRSPNHTAVGARMAREILWQEYGFSGEKELQNFRETICTLIRYHSVPMHILDKENPERNLIQIAAMGELAADFTVERLCILVEADMRGRISMDKESSLELLELCREEAKTAQCLQAPYAFADSFSRYAYLSRRDILPWQTLYDDTWGEVIMMSGLPGTGKDTWIREHYAEMPVISLDEIRKELRILPTENQSVVVNEAKERAKDYLRKKIPFVWNATDLTPMLREKQIAMFANYHASIRIVFLETDWEEQMRRNAGREDVVPEDRIRYMMRSMVVPERSEAHEVEWNCV